MDVSSFGSLLRDDPANAAVGWASVVVAALAAVESAATGDYLWAGFTILFAGVAVLPAAARGDPRVMAPWPLLAVVTGGVTARALGFYPDVAGAVALAGLAIAGVADLDAFTEVEMSRRFAVGFAVLTTLALQGVWTVVQFYADRVLGTGYLSSQVELQWDLLTVTVVALAVGGVFHWYASRFEPPESSTRRDGASGQ